jgi:hypothetical protein
MSLRAALIFPLLLAVPLSVEGEPVDGDSGQCRLAVELDPASGRVAGELVLDLPEIERFLTTAGRLPIALDRRLELEAAAIDGVATPFERAAETGSTPGTDRPAPPGRASWAVELPAAGVDRPISLRFAGVLREDVEAGEAPNRIHNTRMRAHVGEEGIYLAPEAAWHPLLDTARSRDWSSPDPPLCRWTIDVASPVPVVVSGDRVEIDAAAARASWRTPFPQAAVAVAGGPLQAFERDHGAVRIRALLRAGSERHAPGLLDAVARYLDLYQPLVGDYPFREFAVVENFFSSGFAFPGFTLLSSQVIHMGERGLRPGYLDHELLHAWWGHGVLASRASGHWSEALATYCANYMRPLLEGRAEQGRAQRRSVAETLSGSPALAAQAIGDFGLDAEVSTFVGYQKGAMVFDQLAARIGQDRLWAALRRFFRERAGRLSTWDDLRAAFEAESGLDLASFFAFWIDGPGLPSPRLDRAVWDETGVVRLHLAYSDPVPIELALRLRFDDAALDQASRAERVTITPGDGTVAVASSARPAAIEVDPEFETLRRLPPEILMPTLSGLAPPLDLALVAGAGDLDGYAVAAAVVEERYGKTGRLVRGERFDPALLDAGHVLVLGRAVLDDGLLRLFAAEGVEVWERGFAVEAVRHVSPGDAVLACVRNPRRPGAFVCLFWGNAPEALERADLLAFYGGNSLLVFDHGQPHRRRDFEAIERIEVR